MSMPNKLSICAGVVDGLRAADRDTIFWDRALAGFGVRVYPSGRKVYVVQTRAGGAPRRVTIGVHGALDAERARKRAEAVIGHHQGGRRSGGAGGRAHPRRARRALHDRPMWRPTATPTPRAYIEARSTTTSCRRWGRCRSLPSAGKRWRRCTTGCATGRAPPTGRSRSSPRCILWPIHLCVWFRKHNFCR